MTGSPSTRHARRTAPTPRRSTRQRALRSHPVRRALLPRSAASPPSTRSTADSRLRSTARDADLTLVVRVPVTTLCPCSKEISEYGAHNQRGYVEISAAIDPESDLAFEDLIAVAEASGSAPIYPLLKRVDERHVTMQAYDAPTFVEDVVRRATLALAEDERIQRFTVAGREPGEHPRPCGGRDRSLGAGMSDHIRVITTCTSRKVALETEPGHAALPGMRGARRRCPPNASTPASSTAA